MRPRTAPRRLWIALLLLWFGAGRGLAYDGDLIASQIDITPGGIAAADITGDALAVIPDLDGLGTAAIAIGRPGASPIGAAISSGAVDLMWLGPGGTATPLFTIADSAGGDPNGEFTIGWNEAFGTSIAFLGDLDGAVDDRLDIAVGAMDSDEVGTDSGSVWILSLEQSTGEVVEAVEIAHNIGGLGALGSGDRFGSAVASLGDWDGDGVPDLAVGAMGDTVVSSGQGSLYILYMNANGTVRHSARINVSEGGFGGAIAQNENFGSAIAMIADQSGDGRPDLAVSSSGYGLTSNPGSVWILEMGPNCFANTASPACTVLDETEITDGELALGTTIGSAARFGEALAWVPASSGLDVDRLLIGAPEWASGDEGAVFVTELADGLISSSTRIGDLAQWSVDLVNSQQLGGGLAGLGDVDGDGVSDYALGARGYLSVPGRVFTAIAETCPTLILRPIVYHDPTGVGQDPCGPVALPDTSTIEFDLWIESGGVVSTPGPACDPTTGAGDEMCAWDVRLALDGAYQLDPLDAFVPHGPTVTLYGGFEESSPTIMPQELRLNWIKSGAFAVQNGGILLGTVRMTNDGTGPATVRVASGSAAVGARLQLHPIGQRVIGVPEPGFGLGLGFGALLLSFATGTRLRRRRSISAFAVMAIVVGATSAHAQSIKTQIRISENENGFLPTSAFNTNLGHTIAAPMHVDDDGTIDLVFGCCNVGNVSYDEFAWVEFLDGDGAPAGPAAAVQNFGSALGPDALEAVPDRDGDGVPELLMGLPTGTFNGHPSRVMMVFLNDDGSRKATSIEYGPGLPGGFSAPLGANNDRFGQSLAWLGDVDGDPTTDEFAIGTPLDSNAIGVDAGAIWIASLDATNTIVREQEILPSAVGLGIATDWFGQALAPIGDLDGNGTNDLAVGVETCDGGPGCVAILLLEPAVPGPGVSILSYNLIGDGRGGLPAGLPDDLRPDDLAWVNDVPNGAGGVLAVGNGILAGTVFMIHVRADGTARDYYRIYDGAGVGESLAGPWGNSGFGSAVEGPGDLDGDGMNDLVVGAKDSQRAGGGSFSTSEGAVFLFHMIDSDFDGLDDELDNCPGGPSIDPVLSYNPHQADADGDGVGDLCDVCPTVVDPAQLDTDADGLGDECEPVRILLESTGTTALPTWDLLVECGAYDVTELNVGLVPPVDVVDPPAPAFQFTCTMPPAGGQCATFDAVLSNESGPGLGSPAGVRGDAIYVEAIGNGPGLRLCEKNTSRAKIGELTTGAVTTASSVAAAALTEEGVGIPGLSLALAADAGGPIPSTSVELVLGDPTPRATIQLGPAVVTGGNTRWDVLLDAPDNADRFHRVAFGLVAPAGTTTSDMKFVGCETATLEPGDVRTCAGPMAPTIMASDSWTVGPTDAVDTPAGLHDHTMYVVLEGNRFYPPDPPNRYINLPPFVTTLGTVELSGTPDLEPALTLEGVDLIADRLAAGNIDPFERSDVGSLGDLDEVRLVGQFNPAEDEDGDGIQDLADNCPYGQNADQADVGGFQDTDPDGRGDVCQCGDASRDGVVDTSITPTDDDLQQMRDLLAGKITSPSIAADVEARCSVSSGVGCDIRDLVLLQQAIDGATAPETRCDAALSPGPGS